MRTQPEPGNVVQYAFSINFGRHSEMAPLFTAWQDLISDPKLDRRFGSEFVMHELGAVITATFFGTKQEFDATGIPQRIPDSGRGSVVIRDWLGAVAQDAQEAALYVSELRAPFMAKSLAFTRQDLLPAQGVVDLMNYIDKANRGTPIWFLIFDVTGGAINDVPLNQTAYRHRDKVMYSQGYAVGIPSVSETTRNFLRGIVSTIRRSVAGDLSTYAGYVDPEYAEGEAQRQYWGPNLDRLMAVKRVWDPSNLFNNPQSVRPAA